MMNFHKKAWHALLHIALSLSAFIIVIIALAQITLIAGFALLNTGKGQQIIQSQIVRLTEHAPYDVTLNALFYDPVRGLTINGIVVSDDQGTLLTFDRLSIGFALDKLFSRHLDLIIQGGNLVLHRLPASDQMELQAAENKDSILQPFSLPDLFVRQISLSYFAIDRLVVSPKIAGEKIVLSPRAQAFINLSENVSVNLTFAPNVSEISSPVPMPQRLALSAIFSPETLQLTLQNFEIRSTDYSVHLKGDGYLHGDQPINYSLEAAYPDLKLLTSEQIESAALNMRLNGVFSSPELYIDGTVTPARLGEKGLREIKIYAAPNIEENRHTTDLSIQTAYKDDPIEVKATLSYLSPIVNILDLSGTAPGITIKGDGAFNTSIGMADATITINADDLSHYQSLIDTPISGAIMVQAALEHKDAVQSASFSLNGKNIRYDDVRVSDIDGQALIADMKTPWPQSGNITMSRLSMPGDISVRNATLSLSESGHEAYRLSFNGNGRYQKPYKFNGTANIQDITESVPSVRDIDIGLEIGRSVIDLTGHLSAEELALTVMTNQLNITDLPVDLPASLSQVVASGDIRMTGHPSAPETQAGITLNGFDTGEYQGLSIKVDASHANDTASLNISGQGTGIRTLDVQASIPAVFALYPFNVSLPSDSTLAGTLRGDLDVTPLARLFLPPTQSFEGTITTNGTLAGTLSDPAISGTISLQESAYRHMDQGIEIVDISANASFDHNKITLHSLSATDGEQGSLNASGHVGLNSQENSNLSLRVSRFHVPKEGMANGILDADILLNNSGDHYALTGTIDIAEMNIMIPERFQSNIPTLNIVDAVSNDTGPDIAQSIFLDMTINADNQFFVRGWGLDAEFSGNIVIDGTAADPQFQGMLTSRRGRYEEFGKRFDLARANLRFQGSIPPSPYLDVEATTPAEDVTASILLSGPVTAPSITFSSTPALPEDEVLARVLFGRSTTHISPFQAVQLAQTIQRFSGRGGGGLDPLGMLRSLTGFDDITVETNEAGETNIGVGKYLTDKVYLEFEGGRSENAGGANLQIELTPSVNIETEIGQDARAGGGIFWKRDY